MVLASLAACGPPPPPTAEVRGPPAPALVQPPARTLRVVALVDPGARKVAGHALRIGDRIDAASDQFARLFGVRLELLAVRPYAEPVGDLRAALEALEHAAPAPEADLVLLFTTAAAPPRPAMSDLVQSRYLGRSVVVRGLAGLFPPEDGERLQAAEVLALEHGLGTILGALPSCGLGVMADAPAFLVDDGPFRFNSLNLKLIRAHAGLRPGGRLTATVAREIGALLAEPTHQICPPMLVERRQALAAEVAAPPPQADPAITAGVAALEAGRDEEALAACEPIAQRLPASPAARCAGVAAAHLGRNEQAIRYLRAHLVHHPDDGDAVLVLAREVGRGGDDGAARALLARFVEAHPEHVQARINLGVAQARLGDLAGARTQWEAAQKLDPGNADAGALLGQLP